MEIRVPVVYSILPQLFKYFYIIKHIRIDIRNTYWIKCKNQTRISCYVAWWDVHQLEFSRQLFLSARMSSARFLFSRSDSNTTLLAEWIDQGHPPRASSWNPNVVSIYLKVESGQESLDCFLLSYALNMLKN